MDNNSNSILIKDVKGQFKTVDLGVSQKHKETESEEAQKTQRQFNSGTAQEVQKKQDLKKDDIPQPIPPEVTMPSFYFHLEDEQEAARFKDKEQISQFKKQQTVLEYIVDKIVKESNLELPENVMRRLKRVIDSRLRDVRDLRETKEVLMREKEFGGVGLDNDQAQEILKIIESKRIEMQDGLNSIKTLKKHDNIKAEEKEIKKSEKTEENKEIKEQNKVLEKVKPISTYVHPSYQSAPVQQAKKVPGRVLTTTQEIIAPSTKLRQVSQKDTKRPPQLQETEARGTVLPGAEKPHKLVGPIEELASFDLESFRRLSERPKEAVNKIKSKIDLLEDESFEKRAQGIQAWRSSEVYKNYLALGQESLESNRPVSQIISEKQSQNQPTLTFEEFEAIADLNEELSY